MKIFLAAVLLATTANARPGTWETTEEAILESPRVTNWGDWGKFEKCTPGFLVTGFQLKVETKASNNDNTAVNGIRMSCGMPYRPEYLDMERLTSTYGRYGTAREWYYCNGFAVGFQLKSQKPQGSNADDVAAANLKIFCENGEELEGYDENGDFYKDTEYTDKVMCPNETAICGLQTQVERPRWFGKISYKCAKTMYAIYN